MSGPALCIDYVFYYIDRSWLIYIYTWQQYIAQVANWQYTILRRIVQDTRKDLNSWIRFRESLLF